MATQVDDEEVNQLVIATLVQHKGYKIDQAFSGQSAVDKLLARQAAFDLQLDKGYQIDDAALIEATAYVPDIILMYAKDGRLGRCLGVSNSLGVFRDVMMPKMDGYEAVRKIRKLFPRLAIPIIMISGPMKPASSAMRRSRYRCELCS
jgi:CheY-like chemotaxis protein